MEVNSHQKRTTLRLEPLDHEPDVAHRVRPRLLPPRARSPDILPPDLQALPPRKSIPWLLLRPPSLLPRTPRRTRIPFPSWRHVLLPERSKSLQALSYGHTLTSEGDDVERMRKEADPQLGEWRVRDAFREHRVRCRRVGINREG